MVVFYILNFMGDEFTVRLQNEFILINHDIIVDYPLILNGVEVVGGDNEI